MIKKCLRIGLICGLLFFLWFYSGADYQTTPQAAESVPEYIFVYAENQSEGYPTTESAYYFADLVKERTNGRIEIEVMSGGQLGSEASVYEQMQFGGIDFARLSIGSVADAIPVLNVLQMPYLYDDAEHEWEVLDSWIGSYFLDSFQESGIVALSWYDAGARSFYCTEEPITCLEDFSGKKIRVLESSMMTDMILSLGATPVTLSFSNVYSALETGDIDAAENNWPSYDSMQHYRVARYYTLDEHQRIPEVQACSQALWDKLSAEDQQIIRECAAESSDYERVLWDKQQSASEEKLLEAGVEVYYLSDAELQCFRDAVAPLYDKYCSDYLDIVEDIRNRNY